MSTEANLLRAIATGGYSPELDHDGSTAKRLHALAKWLESDRAIRYETIEWEWRQ